jgi:uncharacterized protein YukE
MFGISVLLRFAAQVVQSVMQQFTQQLNVVQEQAFNPLQAVLQQVQSGVWRGVGADAFVDEVSSLTMPGIGIIGDQIRTFQGNLQHAAEIMEAADQQASQTVQAVEEVFSQIINF